MLKGSREKKYLTEEPIQVSHYMDEFADEDGNSNDVSMVVDGSELATCSGHGDNKHTHMIDKGIAPCMSCDMKKHCLCIMKHVITAEDGKDEIENYCSTCYLKKLCITHESAVDFISMENLRKDLSNANVDVPIGATLTKFEDLYEKYVSEGILQIHSNEVDKIKFPLLPN